MNKLQSLQKMHVFIPLMTLIYGIPFGLISYFLIIGGRHKHVWVALLGGLYFGVAMTLLQKKRFQKSIQLVQTYKTNKDKQFKGYIKRSQLPESVAEQQELLAYIDKREAAQKALYKMTYPRKHSKQFAYGFLVFMCIVTLTIQGIRWLAVIYPCIFLIDFFGQRRRRTLERRMAVMRSKLTTSTSLK